MVSVADDGAVYYLKKQGDPLAWEIEETLDDFTGEPVSICASKWDEDTHYWNLYVGVQASNWDNDFIYVYHWNGSTYGSGHAAEDKAGIGPNDKFKGIIHLANGKSGLADDTWNIEDGHYEGTVAVLMYQPELRGYMIRQVDFERDSNYYDFDEDFEYDILGNSHIVWPEAFGVGRQFWDGDDDYGYLYFIGSRNGDLESYYNINTYENTDP